MGAGYVRTLRVGFFTFQNLSKGYKNQKISKLSLKRRELTRIVLVDLFIKNGKSNCPKMVLLWKGPLVRMVISQKAQE